MTQRAGIALALVSFTLLTALNLMQIEVKRLFRVDGVTHTTISRPMIDDGAEPLRIGGTGDQGAGYVHLRFRFRISTPGGHQNLFQTADVNAGIRAEFSGDKLYLLMPNRQTTSGLYSVQLADGLVPGRWYDIDVSALDGSFITADVAGFDTYRLWRELPRFATDDVAVGIGFDHERRFHGDLRDVRVDAFPARPGPVATVLLYALKALLVTGIALGVWFNQWIPSGRPVTVPEPRALYDPLLVLRATACMMVAIGHGFLTYNFTQFVSRATASVLLGWPTWMLTLSPWGGVWIFFTLSGYLMGKGFFRGRYDTSRQGMLAFYRNRCLRILPLYWFTVVTVSVVIAPVALSRTNIMDVVAMLFCAFTDGTVISVLGAMWSIGVEMQFYLLVPLLFVCIGGRLGRPMVIGMTAIAIIAAGLAYRIGVVTMLGWQFWPRDVYQGLLGNLDLFLCGFLANAAVLWLRPRVSGLRYGVPYGLILLLFLVCGLSYASSLGGVFEVARWHAFLFLIMPSLTAVATVTVIVCFELGRKDVPDLLSWVLRRLEILGLLSFAIYLWHEPIFVATGLFFGSITTLGSLIRAVAGALACALAVSAIAYWLIERPFARLKTRPAVTAGSVEAPTPLRSGVGVPANP